jgi:thioredoxin reductase (NADPH)
LKRDIDLYKEKNYEFKYIIADENGITSVPGLFAAGDVRKKRLRQIVTAVSDGACCAVSAEDYLNKNNI